MESKKFFLLKFFLDEQEVKTLKNIIVTKAQVQKTAISQNTQIKLTELKSKYAIYDRVSSGLTATSIIFFAAFYATIFLSDFGPFLVKLAISRLRAKKSNSISTINKTKQDTDKENREKMTQADYERLFILNEKLFDFESKLIAKQIRNSSEIN